MKTNDKNKPGADTVIADKDTVIEGVKQGARLDLNGLEVSNGGAETVFRSGNVSRLARDIGVDVPRVIRTAARLLGIDPKRLNPASTLGPRLEAAIRAELAPTPVRQDPAFVRWIDPANESRRG